MMAHGLLVTLVAWAVLWCVGEAVARLLFGSRARSVASAARLPLGVAAAVCVLETTGYVLPMRFAAWLLMPPAAFGAVLVFRRVRRSTGSNQRTVILTSLLALALGLLPVVIAGRFTAASMTNHDGAYYLTTADWLRSAPWSFGRVERYQEIPPAFCLVQGVLQLWNWRTGTPSLMASISGLSGMQSAQALAVTTALLFACVPCTAITIARGLGIRKRRDEILIGVLSACSAAPAFLAYQHMTGHLGAHSLFPLAGAGILATVRLGGWRRALYAAVLLGAGVALFADGAGALVVIAAAVIVAHARRPARTLLRVGGIAVATLLVAPFTLTRAFAAAQGTVVRRLPRVEPLFPQRGWLPRTPLDDLATLMGIDAWPPWPEAWPPNLQTLTAWGGALAALVLCGFGFARLRGAERVIVAIVGLVVLMSTGLIRVPYLIGKILLSAAAFAVPLAAVGASQIIARRAARWLIVPFAVAELVALGDLARPSRWHVVDRPAHDRLVPTLAEIPAGSLIAFDGLGAPSDEVLDTQRAHRAALLADLRPLHPGLDGGFYRPNWCPDTPRPEPLPSRAYALQRVTSEHLTQGFELAAWDSFRLLSVDLTNPKSFVAAWAPTHAWLSAETEPDGRVLRWAEQLASGTLRIVSAAPCARLHGELRVVRATAGAEIRIADELIYKGHVGMEWSPFVTRAFYSVPPLKVTFQLTQADTGPPDPAHALAVSNLTVQPLWQCSTVLGIGLTQQGVELPIELEREVELSLVAPAAAPCSEISVAVDGEEGATFGLQVDDEPETLHHMSSRSTRVTLPRVETAEARRLKVVRRTDSSRQPWRIVDLTVTPARCER